MLDGLLHHLLVMLGVLLGAAIVGHLVTQRRTPQAISAWLLLIFLIPWLGIPLYLMLGGRKMRALAQQKGPLRLTARSEASPHETPLEKQLDGGGIPPSVAGNQITLNADGVAGYASLLEVIRSAQQSLWLTTFILGRDAVGRAVIDALAERARAGVDVRLLLDGVGSLRVTRRDLAPLLEAGGHFSHFMPLLHLPFRGRSNLRNHRKMTIADGQRVWTGGCNTAAEYIGPEPDPARWTDLSCVVEGPAARVFVDVFAGDWRFATGETLTLPPSPTTEPDEPGARLQVIPSGPDVPNDPLLGGLLMAIFRASRSIRIITPYFVPPESVTQALCLAANRGVDVAVLVPQVSNHRLADWARGPHLREMGNAGVRIVAYPRMIHAKTWSIDGSVIFVGSANCDERSLLLNFEIMTAIHQGEILSRFNDWIDSRFHESQPWRDTSNQVTRIGEGFAEILAPLL